MEAAITAITQEQIIVGLTAAVLLVAEGASLAIEALPPKPLHRVEERRGHLQAGAVGTETALGAGNHVLRLERFAVLAFVATAVTAHLDRLAVHLWHPLLLWDKGHFLLWK